MIETARTVSIESRAATSDLLQTTAASDTPYYVTSYQSKPHSFQVDVTVRLIGREKLDVEDISKCGSVDQVI